MHPIEDDIHIPGPGICCNPHDHAVLEKWAPPCPDGNRQRLCELLGFRLKAVDYLQLRVVLYPSDRGVCQGIVEEHPDRVYVRLLACLYDEDDPDGWSPLDPVGTNCPCNFVLDAPLAERVVIDADTGQELPLFIPRWGDKDRRSEYVPRPPGDVWLYEHPEESPAPPPLE